MDKQGRQEYLAKVEDSLLERQRAHVAAFEELESQGLDLDVLTEIFGVDILRPDTFLGKEGLAFWKDIYKAFNGENRFVAVICTSDYPTPGCHGFGGKMEYQRKAVMRLFTGKLSSDQIKFLPASATDTNLPEITVETPSTTIKNSGERVDSYAPQVLVTSRMHELLKAKQSFWLDGNHAEWNGENQQVGLITAQDINGLFIQLESYTKTPLSDNVNRVGFSFERALEDWLREQAETV